MEIRNFFLLLRQYKLILIFVPLLALLVAYFVVKRMPDTYRAKMAIVTGIIDQKQQVIESQGAYGQEQKNNEEFINLLETIQSDKVVSQVSYALLLHDLSGIKPFRNPDNKLNLLSATYKGQVKEILNAKQQSFSLLNLYDPREKQVDSLLTRLGYDAGTLLKKNVKVFHSEGSDLINIETESDNPLLSAFISNTLSDRFINYYTNIVDQSRSKSTGFLANLLKQKQDAMNKKISGLESYKVSHGILDMADESKDVYGQIGEIETHQQQAEKDVIAYSGALKSIDNRFNPKDRQYVEASSVKVNNAILATRQRLKVLNDKYIQNNFDPRYKKGMDSLQDQLNSQINESSDKFISNPLAAKENIVQEKLKMENDLEIARYSANSLTSQLNSLKQKVNGLVPAQAAVKSYEREIDIATKEYLDVQDKFNQENVNTSLPIQLRPLQAAMPGAIQPSKKILIVVLCGVIGFAICFVFCLLIFYRDDSVRTEEDLEMKTRIPVLGQLNYVPLLKQSPKKFEENIYRNDMRVFRDLLRSIRFEIDRGIKDQQVITVTSLNSGEGKTLFSFSLAYAYAMINKKVLIIDGNFSDPIISKTVKSKEYLEDYFRPRGAADKNSDNKELYGGGEIKMLEISNNTTVGATIEHLNSQITNNDEENFQVSILGNRGGDVSILELNSKNIIDEKMSQLKSKFDIIIIETGPLYTLNKSKEWMLFSDNTVGVFESNRSIGRANKKSVEYLQGLNGSMLGWVFNKVAVKY